jgi:hypothetical protein
VAVTVHRKPCASTDPAVVIIATPSAAWTRDVATTTGTVHRNTRASRTSRDDVAKNIATDVKTLPDAPIRAGTWSLGDHGMDARRSVGAGYPAFDLGADGDCCVEGGEDAEQSERDALDQEMANRDSQSALQRG